MWTTTSSESRTRSARAGCPASSRIASLSACSALLFAGCGCGGETTPAIPPETAEALAERSEQVADALARGEVCEADELADELVRESEAADVPQPHRRELLASARSLAERIDCPPPPPPTTAEDDDEDGDDENGKNGKGKNGKGKGNGKKGGRKG